MQRECRWQRDVGTRTRQEEKASSRLWLVWSRDRDTSWRAWGESSPHLETDSETQRCEDGKQRDKRQQRYRDKENAHATTAWSKYIIMYISWFVHWGIRSLDLCTHFSGLNPSTSSRNTLLWDTESALGTIRNLSMVPLVEPRNKTVRFLWGPASVSTTMAVSWYLRVWINRDGQ